MERKIFFKSPLGILEIKASSRGITFVGFVRKAEKTGEINGVLKKCLSQLKEYFSGKREIFNLPLDLKGMSWQKKVWQKIMNVPFGRTVFYGDFFGGKAARAVGSACAGNKILLIIPCHRVVGKNGLGGYSAGLWRKRRLLDFEKNKRFFKKSLI